MNKIKQYIENRRKKIQKYRKEYEIESDPENYIHIGLDSSFKFSDIQKFQNQTIKGLIEVIVEEIENIERGGEQDEIHDEVRERTLLEVADLLKTIIK